MNIPANITMINGATAEAISNVFVNNNCASVTLQITGSFTTATVQVEGLVNLNSNSWVSLGAIELSEFEPDSDGLSEKSLYQVGIEGIPRVRIHVTAVSGGDITVVCQFGNAVIDPASQQNIAELIAEVVLYDSNLAPEYTPGTYSVGDLVIFNKVLYQCNTQIDEAEPWDAEKWDHTTIAEIIKSL